VFFSFPHIAIDSEGVVGNISRPGRSAMSCACGALIKSLSEIKKDGLTCSCKTPGGMLCMQSLRQVVHKQPACSADCGRFAYELP
jgi:hypothetical protein